MQMYTLIKVICTSHPLAAVVESGVLLVAKYCTRLLYTEAYNMTFYKVEVFLSLYMYALTKGCKTTARGFPSAGA